MSLHNDYELIDQKVIMILSIYASNNRQIQGQILHDVLYEVPKIVKHMSRTYNGGNQEMEKGENRKLFNGYKVTVTWDNKLQRSAVEHSARSSQHSTMHSKIC